MRSLILFAHVLGMVHTELYIRLVIIRFDNNSAYFQVNRVSAKHPVYSFKIYITKLKRSRRNLDIRFGIT